MNATQPSTNPVLHQSRRAQHWPIPWWLRAGIVAVGLAAWFWTQSLIGHRAGAAVGIGDRIHVWTAPAHDYLLAHPQSANALLAVSSGCIDSLVVFLLGSAIFGRTFRPFIGLLLVFAMRQVAQALCALPAPDGMIWHNPGFPSLVVTYGVSNDLFFSGHTALAILGTVEVARLDKPWLTWLAVAVAVFEVLTVLVLRAHYTMDVIAGALAAFLAAAVAEKIAGRNW